MKEKTKSTPRRSPGEASYRKRADGSWEGRITINYKPYSVYGKSRGECKTKIGILKDKLALGVSRTTPSLAEWLDTWLKDIVALDKKPSTHTNYKTIAEMHLKPDLGRIRLDKLTRGDVQRLISKKARTDLAARTVRLIHRVLHCALNRAVKLKMIAINPASDLVLPRIEHTAMATVSPEQVFQLQSTNLFETEPMFPCVLLMVYTGLRRGEALALRWPDIDLHRGTVTVQREIVKAAGGTVYQSPKTKRSNRLVPFGDALKSILLAHKQRQDDFIKKTKDYIDEGLVFARETGKPYYPDSMRKILHRILRKAGIPAVRVHDLRHTCATLLMLSGVHSKVVQEMLGHSNISVTLDTYSHTLPSMRSEAADSINDFIAESKATPVAKTNNPPAPDNSQAPEPAPCSPMFPAHTIPLPSPGELPHPSKMN